MLALKFFLMILGLGLFGSAGIIVAYDVYVAARLRWLLEQSSGQGGAEGITLKPDRPFGPIRSKLAGALALAGILPVLLALSISVVPDGYAGIRVSQISGVHPATLYPGAHFQTPFIDTIVLYGLDPTRLGSIHQNLPQPVGDQVVAPVVSSIYRQLAPNYETREIFAVKREELRTHAAEAIKTRLASGGIVVREVLLRDIQLPAEYAKGLEGLLLKEQENEQLETEQQIKQKQVKIAELEAEAQKSRDIKQAEAQAQVHVLQAKSEADAMQYTLPLKQKQIEQSKLEAEARKDAKLQNAEAAAQAKIIDSKAEIERQKNLADAEANRIRVTAAADSERMKYEASVLKQNPMLIQKIIAERLSDKRQIIMVPMDGKNFFAADVMRSAFQNNLSNNGGSASLDTPDGADEPAPVATATSQRKPQKRP